MIVQIHTDNHVDGKASLHDWVRQEVTDSLSRFAPQLTRVEVFLSDANAGKTADNDKQCKLELRLSGLDPFAISKNADTLEVALSAAIEAASLTLDDRLEKVRSKKGRTPMGGEP